MVLIIRTITTLPFFFRPIIKAAAISSRTTKPPTDATIEIIGTLFLFFFLQGDDVHKSGFSSTLLSVLENIQFWKLKLNFTYRSHMDLLFIFCFNKTKLKIILRNIWTLMTENHHSIFQWVHRELNLWACFFQDFCRRKLENKITAFFFVNYEFYTTIWILSVNDLQDFQIGQLRQKTWHWSC